MITRPAAPSDAGAIAAILAECWRTAYRGIVPDAHLGSLDPERWAVAIRSSIESGPEATLVAVRDGSVIGLATFGPCRDDDLDARCAAELWGLYVAPDYWHQGVGTTVREAAESALQSSNTTEIVTWVFEGNAAGRRFYEASGYTTDGSRKVVEAGAPIPALRYHKRLPCLEPAARADKPRRGR